jgi:leucyl aminopeptidase
MNKIDKIITKTKRLANLRYNEFNLENFWSILDKNYSDIEMIETDVNSPIQLMSGNNPQAGIVKKGKGNVYLVGKGVLFDSGGMCLKVGTHASIEEMYDDKTGMLIALAIADLFPNEVTAFCPVSTNFIHISKIIPGDILTIGKRKVEMTDTDAEGRVLLSEAITKINASKSDTIITIATLTGAVEYAIGNKATGIFSNNENLLKKYADASFEAKELAWGLPLWNYMDKAYKKEKILRNWHKEYKCGASEAATFLLQFVPNPNKFLHLDIASSAFDDRGRPNGVPIKSLINFIEKIK